MVGVFGTMVADVTHVALGVPYAVSTPVFLAALVAVFVLWRTGRGPVDVHTITSTRRQLFYWAAVIATCSRWEPRPVTSLRARSTSGTSVAASSSSLRWSSSCSYG